VHKHTPLLEITAAPVWFVNFKLEFPRIIGIFSRHKSQSIAIQKVILLTIIRDWRTNF